MDKIIKLNDMRIGVNKIKIYYPDNEDCYSDNKMYKTNYRICVILEKDEKWLISYFSDKKQRDEDIAKLDNYFEQI